LTLDFGNTKYEKSVYDLHQSGRFGNFAISVKPLLDSCNRPLDLVFVTYRGVERFTMTGRGLNVYSRISGVPVTKMLC